MNTTHFDKHFQKVAYETCRHLGGNEANILDVKQHQQVLRNCYEKLTTAFTLSSKFYNEAVENR